MKEESWIGWFCRCSWWAVMFVLMLLALFMQLDFATRSRPVLSSMVAERFEPMFMSP
jgi:hypothetical protein